MAKSARTSSVAPANAATSRGVCPATFFARLAAGYASNAAAHASSPDANAAARKYYDFFTTGPFRGCPPTAAKVMQKVSEGVPIEETVPLRLCMQGSIEKVKKLRTKVASAIARCEGIGAKGEVSELRYVSQTLDQGRSGPLRAPRGGFENAAWNIFQSGNSSDVRAYEEQAAAAAEIDRKAEQMARQRTEAEADRRRQEAADAKSRKRAAEAESRAADTERKKEEYREKKAQEAAAAAGVTGAATAGVAGAATAGGAGGSAAWGAVKAAGHIGTAVQLANGTHWAQTVGGFVGEQILEQAAIGAAGTAIAGAGGAAAGGGAAAFLPFLTPPCSIQ